MPYAPPRHSGGDLRKVRISESPERFLTQAAIAEELNVSESSVAAVAAVVAGRSRSRRIEQAISQHVNVPLWVLWPKWHGRPSGAEHNRNAA